MRWLMVFRIEKYVGPARGPARLLHFVHLEGVHRLLLLPCVFSPVLRIKKCAGPARGPARWARLPSGEPG